jgi:hypothetical protein
LIYRGAAAAFFPGYDMTAQVLQQQVLQKFEFHDAKSRCPRLARASESKSVGL